MSESTENLIKNLINHIEHHDQFIWENAQAVIRAQQQNRKNRKKRVGELLLVSPGSFLGMQRAYDDGSNEFLQISCKLTGQYRVYRLDLQGWEDTEMFGIFFWAQDVWITGSKRKLKPSRLFESFVESAGEFLPGVSHALIGNLLYDHFANQIIQAENCFTVTVHAGWNNGKFLHRDNFLFRKNKDFSNLPVMKKRFSELPLKREHIHIYFEELRNIYDWKNRIIIALYPFVGILASVVNSFGCPVNFCINFVEMNADLRKRICSWLKVFGRDYLGTNSLDINKSDLEKMLYESNDEVLIFDANYTELDSIYAKNKIKNNVIKIIRTMKKQGNYGREKRNETSFACVFFSEGKILEEGVINIWADHNLCQNRMHNLKFLESKTMEAILSDFVCYVTKNLEEIWGKIIRKGNEDEEKYRLLVAVYAIYRHYWEAKGVEIWKVLKLPESICWNQVTGDFTCDENEILEEFVVAVRKNISKYYAVEKKKMAPYRQDAVYFSDDFIWIPTKIFYEILEGEGIQSYHNEIILLLKETGKLLTDNFGYSRKILISKNQFEAYQIKISIFDEMGKVRLLDLARRVEKC